MKVYGYILYEIRVTMKGNAGMVYGALGGLGFSILEMAASFALVDFPKSGWSNLPMAVIGKMTFLGTDLHILWSAALGAAIGYGVTSKRPVARWLVPIGMYIYLAVDHILNDLLFHTVFIIPGIQAAAEVVAKVKDTDIEGAAALMKDSPQLLHLSLIAGGTSNLILTAIFILPGLFMVLWRTGASTRSLIARELQSEPAEVITAEELAGAEAEERFHLRSIPGYPKPQGRAIRRLQNELAFRKDYVSRTDGSSAADEPSEAIREDIRTRRS